MTAILAWGAVSGLGEGEAAFSAGAPGERARVAIARDPALEAAGLARPFASRAGTGDRAADGEDRATALLSFAFSACALSLDEALPGWRAMRVGVAMGTSSGPMGTAERFFRDARTARAPAVADVRYDGPLRAVLARHGLAPSPVTLVLGACASSSIAIGLGARWLELDRCDVVLAGGFDAVTVFVAAGFEALRATTEALPPRPFRVGRDGMALGEGAAVLALARAGVAPARAYVAGFAASCDAVHVTAPDWTGGGLARAASRALAERAIDAGAVELVSGHATATPFNDAAESRALAAVLGPRALEVPMHAFKAQIGHTLGAAGALEALACLDAMERGVLPATAGQGAPDPDAPARLLEENLAGAPRVALKLASAFGGANAALVLTRDPPPPRSHHTRAARAAFVTRAVHVTGPPATLAPRVAAATLARADGLVRLGLAALVELEALAGGLAGAGIVVGHAFATLETNALFYARIAERGARAAEPRRFPYTSPNGVCGECAVAFGLTGPAFAVGAGAYGGVAALAVARDLVAAGDADRVVVLAVDELGPAARALLGPSAGGMVSGAVAALVTADPAGAVGRLADATLSLGAPLVATTSPERAGHVALMALASPQIALPICLSTADEGSFAQITVVGL